MITVRKIIKTCNACPAQWAGITTDDRQIYFRYRWGYLSVSVSEPGAKDPDDAVLGDEIFGVDHGDEFGGYMGYDELKRLTADALILPETESEWITDPIDWSKE